MVIAAPDYSRRQVGLFNQFKNTNKTLTNYIFKVRYPCFVCTNFEGFGGIDNDIFIEFAKNPYTSICYYQCEGKTKCYALHAAVKRDPTFQVYHFMGSQSMSNIFNASLVNWWYHTATGAGVSDDSGDDEIYDGIIRRKTYIIPYLNTPKNQPLVDYYIATYTTKNYFEYARNSNNDPKTVKNAQITAVSYIKTIYAL